MAINLSKGGRIDLSKEAPGLTKVQLGLGWNPRVTDGAQFDLDASLLMVNAEGKATGEGGFVFYGAATSACGSVVHKGDNRTGDGDGDDEVIEIDLGKVPTEAEKLIIAVTIHDAAKNNQNFGQVDDAYIEVRNAESNDSIARFDLTEDASTETAMIFGELYRKDGSWRFAAKGDGFAGGLTDFLSTYGLNA